MTKFVSQYLLKVKALTWGERFSFGNGGRDVTGYITIFPVRILGMSLSSARKAGDVTVALPVNYVEIPECMVYLNNDRPKKHDILIFHLR